MIIERAASFKKSYKKRIASNEKLVRAVNRRLILFVNNPMHPLLRTHELKGNRRGVCAFSVGGDIRIIYQPIDKDKVRFIDIGSHNQVY